VDPPFHLRSAAPQGRHHRRKPRGAQLNDKVSVLEDLLSSRIAGNGYSVLSRDVVTRALKDYSTGNAPTTGHRAGSVRWKGSTTASGWRKYRRGPSF